MKRYDSQPENNMPDYKAAFEDAMETLRDLARARQLGWNRARDCEHIAQMAIDGIEVTYDIPSQPKLNHEPLREGRPN